MTYGERSPHFILDNFVNTGPYRLFRTSAHKTTEVERIIFKWPLITLCNITVDNSLNMQRLFLWL